MLNRTNAPIIKGVTEKYDEIVPISQIKFDKDNRDLYRDNDTDYFNSLVESIKTLGLINPIVLYDNDECKSGHTRVEAAIKANYTHMPVIRSISKKPTNSYENMMALMMENQGRPGSISRQYHQIETTINAFEKEHSGSCREEIIKLVICPAAQMSYTMYCQLRTLEIERPDLFKRVIDSDGNALSPGKADQLRKQDKKGATILPMSKILDTIVTREDIIYAVNAVSNAMSQLDTILINARTGKQVKAFDNVQQNILGGLAHEIFVNSVSHSINYKEGVDEYSIAFPPKSHNNEDIQFPTLNAGIEVKTCVIKDGNKIRFINSKPKTGYYLLTAFSPEYEYAYCAFGYLDHSVWKKAGRGPSQCDLEKLINSSNMDNFFGELKLDKKTGRVFCYPSKLGI